MRIQTWQAYFQGACRTSRAADTDARSILTAHLPCSHLEASINDGLQALDEPVSARWRASCHTSLDGVKVPVVSTHGTWDFKDASAWQDVSHILKEKESAAVWALSRRKLGGAHSSRPSMS